jgi:hypothetical protein
MPARVEVIHDIPEDQKQRITEDYEAVGASVQWDKQPDGKWTGTATFPSKDKPTG